VRGRAVGVQAALAAAALGLAAWTWLRPATPALPGAVPATSFQAGQVSAVRFDDGSHAVDVVRAVAGAPGVRVRIARSPSLAPPDAGVSLDGGTGAPPLRVADGGVLPRPDGGVGRNRADGGVESLLQALKEAPPPPDRELRGNETAEQLLDRVAPLMATRDLGQLGADRREQLGLGATTRTLRIEGPASSIQFRVANPPGAAGTYLLGSDERVWVVADALTQDLSAAASRLVDRRLHAFKPDDPDAVTLLADGRTRSYVVRRIQGLNKLAPAESPDAPSAEATAWADRVWRLSPVELLGRGEVPREGPPQQLLRVEYFRNRRPLGHLELARAGNEAYLRTEHTVGWVRVPAGSVTLAEQADRLETEP
jgi:hypothetical protein